MTTPTANNNNTKEHKPGMECPECGFFINMSIETILYQSGIQCAGCGLKLTMNRNMSNEALQALQNLDTAIKNVNHLKSKYQQENK